MANKTSDEIQTLDISNWKDGMVSYFSKERMGQNALKTAYNVIFDYNGVVRPRGSFYESGIPDVPDAVYTNLITNPSFESSMAPWSAVAANGTTGVGTATIVADSPDTPVQHSVNIIPSSSASYAALRYPINLAANTTYTVSFWVKGTGAVKIYLVGANWTSSTTSLTGSWQRVSYTFTQSVASTDIDIVNDTVNQSISIDKVLLEQGNVLHDYFDGSTVDTSRFTYTWNGAVNASTSTRTSSMTPLACDFPFRRADDSDGLLNIFSDGTNAYLYVLKADGTEWEKFPTAFDKDAQFSIDQIDNVVVFGNGVDKFSYYDIAKNVLQQLTKVADPTVAPTVTPVNFGTGTAMTDYYYRVAFNGVGGTTKMSPAVKVTSSNVRESWDGSKSVTVDISPLTIDPNAKSWSVWIASVNTGLSKPVDKSYMRISNITDMNQKTFSDTGAQAALDIQAPIENSTEGLIAPYFKNISGRLWAISPDRTKVCWGGDASDIAEDDHSLYFGTTNGSDSFSIGKGGVERAMSVILGRDNSGTTCINVLTRTTAGQGAIWDVYATTNSITYNGNSYSKPTYQFKKREGNDGTDAPFSAIRENNNVYYLSMEGFKSTGVKPNITGIQSTDIVSSAIRDRIINLTHSDLSKCYAAYYDEAIYWTINYGSDHNNEIWVYDILHGGIWSIWRRTTDCIFRWSSNDDKSPSLYIRVGNKLLRYLKESFSHSDFDGVFKSYIDSGLIAFGSSNLEWVHVLKALWQLNNAMGTVDIVLNVHNAIGEIMDTATAHLSSLNASSVHGGWDNIKLLPTMPSLGTWNHREWDKTLISLDVGSLQQDVELDQRVRQNAAYVSFSLKSNTAETYYELSHFSLLYTYIGIGIEFLTRRNVISI